MPKYSHGDEVYVVAEGEFKEFYSDGCGSVLKPNTYVKATLRTTQHTNVFRVCAYSLYRVTPFACSNGSLVGTPLRSSIFKDSKTCLRIVGKVEDLGEF